MDHPPNEIREGISATHFCIFLFSLLIVFLAQRCCFYLCIYVSVKRQRTHQEPVSPAFIDETTVLDSFYESTSGRGWRNNDNWCSSALIKTWNGLSSNRGKVVGLSLENNNLSGWFLFSKTYVFLNFAHQSFNFEFQGYLPASIGKLSMMTELDLSSNWLRGEILVIFFWIILLVSSMIP